MGNKAVNIFSFNTENKPKDKIIDALSKYTEMTVNADKSVTYRDIPTAYFLKNDKWHIEFFGKIEQFKIQIDNWNFTGKTISFPFNSENINKEMKFIVYSKLFSEQWTLITTIKCQMRYIRRLAEFINEKYPNINSFKQIDLEKTNFQWIDWLNNKDVNVTRIATFVDKKYEAKSGIANFLRLVINSFNSLTDEREEWKKDRWDVRNLEQYGVTYNKSMSHYFIDFEKINNFKIREAVKKYMKQRLLGSNKFSWSSAQNYLIFLPPFLNLICELEPSWSELKDLKRHHIEKYLEWLNIYTKENLNQKNANPKRYKSEVVTCVDRFLSDIQDWEYDIAPIINTRRLIFPNDKPKVPIKPNDQIDYVPDFVLEQLFENINNLRKDVIPVVWVMYKTGLRVSDALELTHDCLVKLNGQYWVVTDIEKVYVEGHRIPIDDELANMLAVLIDESIHQSNQDNNPEKLIFVRYTGSRKGKPYGQGWITKTLNQLAIKYNINDELGKRFHFKNHAFRHTYAVKSLNGGMDIMTLMNLMAHASPEMTLRYAKLLDDTKRKEFNKVVKSGVFTFDESDKIKQENDGEIPTDVIDMLYTNHKLNAISTPYGTCMQKANGKCGYAKLPPCLTCNSGSPCKDLCVGAVDDDNIKYEILIRSTKNIIENAKFYGRDEIIKDNEELLKLYKSIYSTLQNGGLIYGRINRLKKKEV